ncbi:TonB-dependent receptor plug domain-containing protein [Inhella gelatinilytica]|uniref:TonB-dependent receptor n=1 Tax=Inhella gelatinilytica TaxID=2795030 RepID=A0A931IYD8_9BURK|nr:TonB-dependent receptor [Inhella gelatinilytica]MBH9552106.1 TonB-dependent receptor [Inhella gelatinilytica]
MALFKPLILACLAAWAPTGSAAEAETDELEALLQREVEGPSRYAQSLLDAPAPVAVIGRQEVELLGLRQVSEMLARLPGIHLSHSRQYVGVGLRGFNRPGDYNARLLMAIDGFRSNDALYDQALPDTEFPLAAEWVKRLELIYGPSSSIYGSNALLGAVNLVTLDGADAPGVRVKGSVGQFGGRRALLQYGQGGAVDVFIGAQFQRSRGETLELPELGLPSGALRGLDALDQRSLFAKLRAGAWRLSLSALERDKALATAPYGTVPGAAGTRYVDRSWHAELAYEEDWTDALRRSLRVGVGGTGFDGHYVYPDALINRDLARSRWINVDGRVQWRGWLNHEWLLGVEVRSVPRGLQRNFDLSPATTYLDSQERSHSAGLYLQDQWRLSPRLQLTTGARVDHIRGFAAHASPRLALVFRAQPGEAYKLMLGQAFRTPNLAERFYDDGGVSQQANPNLGPERLRSAELAWERELDAHSALGLSVYQTRLRDLIEPAPTDTPGVIRYLNHDHVHSQGLQLSWQQRVRADHQWRLDLTLMQAHKGGERLSNAPRWVLKGHWMASLAPHWGVALEAQGQGARTGRVDAPAQWLAHAALRYTGWTGQHWMLRVQNLTDARSFDPAGPENEALLRVPHPRRTLRLDWQLSW